jgi:hypothetical protein
MTLIEQIRSARLSFADIEYHTGGVVTENKLKKHNSGEKLLSPDDQETVRRFVAAHRIRFQKRALPEVLNGLVAGEGV